MLGLRPKGSRPVGYGMIVGNPRTCASTISVIGFGDPRIARGRADSRLRYEQASGCPRIIPYPDGTVLMWHVSKHFVPGYLH
jgi:hypothetical protein